MVSLSSVTKVLAARIPVRLLPLLAGTLMFPQGLFAAGEAGEKWGIWLTIGGFFNLALVVAIIVGVARAPLASFFKLRSQLIREQLAEAQEARREAVSKLAEIQARLSRLDDELKQMNAIAEAEARQEYRKLVAETERDGGKIVERARQEIDGMMRTAQLELKTHVAELAVQLAEERLRNEITGEDRRRLFRQFVSRVGVEK